MNYIKTVRADELLWVRTLRSRVRETERDLRKLKGARCSKNQYLTLGPEEMGQKELAIGVWGVMETREWGKNTGRASQQQASVRGLWEGGKWMVCWVLSRCVKVTLAGSFMESRSQTGCGLRNEGEVQIEKLVFTMVTIIFNF